jgi:hypothetical protein
MIPLREGERERKKRKYSNDGVFISLCLKLFTSVLHHVRLVRHREVLPVLHHDRVLDLRRDLF